MVAHASDTRLLVLHALRLKGMADTGAIAAASELAPSVVEAELADLLARAMVRFLERRDSWSLTPEGRGEHARLLTADLDDAGCAGVVESAYGRVLGVNAELLATITALQQGDQAVDRLRAVHHEAIGATAELAVELDRMRSYGPRLTGALERVERGEREWVARPLIDSYHSVWHELHEDLLLTLGIDRSAEQEVRT
jgi:DNA-binding transcriptional ArsR family regulator